MSYESENALAVEQLPKLGLHVLAVDSFGQTLYIQ